LGGKRYRGDLAFDGSDSGIVVVNRLRMDDYLRGVVPLELGRTRSMAELAAVEAQAVAARSYAVVRIRDGIGRPWDVLATVTDQVYGGVDAETDVASRAIENTAGLVLRYGGRVVSAPFHSTCGGRTAGAPELWRSGAEPYLQSVSDRIPGTDRYYCDAAPRFRWTQALDGSTLDAAVARYLGAYAKLPAGGPGRVRAVVVTSRTESGRVGTLAITTTRGTWSLRGNEIRAVLRRPGGEMLASTYFTLDATAGAGGGVERLTIRGSGYGHGVGMCQWGAIGRARAGQDFRTILGSYFPGTTVGRAE
jgi:stage II sporulation protein D